MGLFLDRNGGPREGAIRLPPEKLDIPQTIPEEGSIPPSPTFEHPQPRPFIQALGSKILQNLFRHLPWRSPRAQTSPSHVVQPAVRLGSPRTHFEEPRTPSRTSRVNGSAYGYSSNYRRRLAGSVNAVASRRGSLASSLRRRRGSGLDTDNSGETSDLNFAQRLLMANENAVTNIADLWVAAALNVDSEDPFESDEGEETGLDDSAGSLDLGEPLMDLNDATSTTPVGYDGRSSSNVSPTRHPHHPGYGAASPYAASGLLASRHRSTSRTSSNRPATIPDLPQRRMSNNVPSIFSHPGVKSPAAHLEAQRLVSTADESIPISGVDADVNTDVEALEEKPVSLTSQLPFFVIVQYGLLALHSTTHDQIFMSYLVTYVLPQHHIRVYSHSNKGLQLGRIEPRRRTFRPIEYVFPLPFLLNHSIRSSL